jgi:predicted phosphohydrolase
MTYNENIKTSIYKWRNNNREKYNDVCRVGCRKWKEKNKDYHNKKELERYYYKKECLRLRNILIDYVEQKPCEKCSCSKSEYIYKDLFLCIECYDTNYKIQNNL